jgi:hypothetical protein
MSALDRDVPRRPQPIGRSLVLFALGWLAFTWPWLFGFVTIPWDAKAHFYPQIVAFTRALQDGESPFWLPFVFSGHPQIADPQSLIFSPYALLALVTDAPSFTLVDTTTFVILGLGAVAVIFGFRDRGWHWAGAVVAALVFAFGASAAWRVQHLTQVMSLAMAAMTYLFLSRALARSSYLYAALASVTGALMLVNRDQVALVAAYLMVGMVFVTWAGARRPLAAIARSIAPLSVGAILGLGLIAMPILMSAAFGAQSNRPSIDFAGAGGGSLHPVHLLTLFFADLYGSSGPMEEVWGPPSFTWNWTGLFLAQNMYVLYIGAVPVLALVAVGIVQGALWHREVRGFTVAAALVLLYALGWYTPLFWLAYEFLPGIDLFRRPADVTFLFGALFGVLAGYCVHLLASGEVPIMRRWQWTVAIGLVFGAVVWAIGLAVWFERATTKALVPLVTGVVCLSLGTFILAAARRWGTTAPIAITLLLVTATAADLIWNNGPTPSTAMPPAYHDVLRPETRDPVMAELRTRTEATRSETRRDRVELVGLGFLWPNATLVHGLEHTLGYNPLRVGLYSRTVGAIDTVGTPEQRQFPPSFPSYRSDLANMLGLRWIVTPEPIEAIDRRLRPGALPLIARPGGRYLYENTEALPRVVLATNARPVDQRAILEGGEWPIVDYTRTVLLEGQDHPPETTTPGRARLVRYRNTEVIVEAAAPPGGGWVVLFDPWHPWWFADVDGAPAEVLRANVAFRAVRVPEGQSRVRFVFRPIAGLLTELRSRLARS